MSSAKKQSSLVPESRPGGAFVLLLGFALSMCPCLSTIAAPATQSDWHCETVAVRFGVQRSESGTTLAVTVVNTTDRVFRFPEYRLYETMLDLEAKDQTNGRELTAQFPLAYTNADVLLDPGKSFTKVVDLNEVFPELENVTRGGSALVSWKVDLRSKSACYKAVISSSIVLEH